MYRTIEKAGRPYLLVTVIDATDGDAEHDVEIPCEWTVCPNCAGSGGSSNYLGSFTAKEWAEEDPEFQDDYMSGRFDQLCSECDGRRVVARIPERESLSNEEQIEALEAHEKYLLEEVRDRTVYRAEMHLMGDC